MTNKLPYVAKTTFSLNGHLHDDEPSALRAAITQELGNAGIASKVIAEGLMLAPLLARAVELGMCNKMPIQPAPKPYIPPAPGEPLPLPEPPCGGKTAAELAAETAGSAWDTPSAQERHILDM